MATKRVRDLLDSKGDFVLTIGSDATAREALETMVDHNVGSILVQDEDTVHGIFSDRDYLRRVVLAEGVAEQVPIREVMTSDMIVVSLKDKVEDCMGIMTQQRIRHLPVVEEGELKGLISIGDCVKSLSDEREFKIKQLEKYISGNYPD